MEFPTCLKIGDSIFVHLILIYIFLVPCPFSVMDISYLYQIKQYMLIFTLYFLNSVDAILHRLDLSFLCTFSNILLWELYIQPNERSFIFRMVFVLFFFSPLRFQIQPCLWYYLYDPDGLALSILQIVSIHDAIFHFS